MLGLATLGAVGLFVLLWLRKRHLQVRFDRQFKGFRDQAVTLMDQVDALRQRHKGLTATAPEYTQPMAGATLALYQAVQNDLSGLWDRWLHVMDVWNQAQTLVRAGSGLAGAKIGEARKLIEREGNFQELIGQCGACAERLDRLTARTSKPGPGALSAARLQQTFPAHSRRSQRPDCRRPLYQRARCSTGSSPSPSSSSRPTRLVPAR